MKDLAILIEFTKLANTIRIKGHEEMPEDVSQVFELCATSIETVINALLDVIAMEVRGDGY